MIVRVPVKRGQILVYIIISLGCFGKCSVLCTCGHEITHPTAWI